MCTPLFPCEQYLISTMLSHLSAEMPRPRLASSRSSSPSRSLSVSQPRSSWVVKRRLSETSSEPRPTLRRSGSRQDGRITTCACEHVEMDRLRDVRDVRPRMNHGMLPPPPPPPPGRTDIGRENSGLMTTSARHHGKHPGLPTAVKTANMVIGKPQHHGKSKEMNVVLTKRSSPAKVAQSKRRTASTRIPSRPPHGASQHPSSSSHCWNEGPRRVPPKFGREQRPQAASRPKLRSYQFKSGPARHQHWRCSGQKRPLNYGDKRLGRLVRSLILSSRPMKSRANRRRDLQRSLAYNRRRSQPQQRSRP